MPPDQPVNPAEEPPPSRRIGRHPGNDIIVMELGVSKQHAELRRTPAGRYTITDLGSHNGTYVNGTRVSQQDLNEGDVIAIGQATFRLVGGELTGYVDDGNASRADGPATIRPATPEEAETALLRERDRAAELRGQLEACAHRVESLQAELRALAAGDPAVLPVLGRLGISPEPEA
jgi:hypothetical protein